MVISTITLGVGIGVLAQPQLVVRFMTVRSKRELNRATLIGGVFIIVMTGVAFTVGALSNAYFADHGAELSGRVVKTLDEGKGLAVLQIMKPDEQGVWRDVPEKTAPVKLSGNGGSQPGADGQTVAIQKGRSISVVYAGGSADEIIPTYITCPASFIRLAPVSAAMSMSR
jgi:SSS family solute:Na+ symporter